MHLALHRINWRVFYGLGDLTHSGPVQRGSLNKHFLPYAADAAHDL